MHLAYLERYSKQVGALVVQNTALRRTVVNTLTHLPFSFSKQGSVSSPGVNTGGYLGNYGDWLTIRLGPLFQMEPCTLKTIRQRHVHDAPPRQGDDLS